MGSRKSGSNGAKQSSRPKNRRTVSGNAEKLKSEIRLEVAERRLHQSANAPVTGGAGARLQYLSAFTARHHPGVHLYDQGPATTNGTAQNQPCGINWTTFEASLEQARQHVEIGRELPQLGRLKGPFRHLGRMAAAFVLYLSRFLTNRQSAFNSAGVTAIQQLADSAKKMHFSNVEQIRRLENQLGALRQQRQSAGKNNRRKIKLTKAAG